MSEYYKYVSLGKRKRINTDLLLTERDGTVKRKNETENLPEIRIT